MTVLAVDLGGTKVAAAVVTTTGEIIEQTRFRRLTGENSSTDELAASITATVREALAAAPPGTDVEAVGLAAAGPIDEASGTIAPINVAALQDFPLRELVADAASGRPVQMRRDGVAIVLGEHWLGAGAGHDNVLGMVVSTGIGGGFIVSGRAIAGNAGHIGQVELSGFTGEPSLGRTTMLESVASGPHIVAWARARGFDGATGEDLAAAFRAGDELAAAAVRRCVCALAQGIGTAVALVPVDVVVLGGGFATVADDFAARVQAELSRHPLPYVARTQVRPAGLGADAPLVGAAALVYRSELLP